MVTYIILDYPDYLDRKEVDNVFAKAFNEWGVHIGRSFGQVKYSAQALLNITFKYAPKIIAMDSEMILAAGKYPIFGGSIRFNSLVNWSTSDTISQDHHTSLYHVALHEIGHTLGLLHSSYPSSIMTPYFMRLEKIQLHNNDKQRIRFLYNAEAPQSIQTKPIPNPYTWHVPSLCNLTKIDAIIALTDSELYVFHEHQTWLLEGWTEQITFTGDYPLSISFLWPELPSKIDAAYVHPNGEVYFFRGSQCWRYADATDLVEGYPRIISDEFPGIPSDLDAAMVWSDNHTYFFKGSQYWRYDKDKKTAVLDGFPKPISTWGDIPNDLDAVFFYKFETFFFKEMAYYKHKPVISPDTARYPRPTAFWWFLC